MGAREHGAAVVVPAPEPTESDAELAERAQAGDRWAEEALLVRHIPRLHALLTRLLRDPVEADDALQDTLVLVLRDLPKLSEPSAVAGWLRRIAVFRAHRRFRRRRLHRWVGLGADEAGDGLIELASRDASPETRAELALVDRALRRLSPGLETVWLLRHVEGYTLEEVAEASGCGLATVKRRLNKADRIVSAQLKRGET